MNKKPDRRIKCPGRFSELREYLHNDVLDTLRGCGFTEEGTNTITEQNLIDMWFLIASEIHRFDKRDPYYESRTDTLRKKPALEDGFGYFSLIPLFPSTYHFEDGIIEKYLSSMKVNKGITERMLLITNHTDKFFHRLGREPSKVYIPIKNSPKEVNLSGYIISADYGLGTAVPGGVEGGGIRSDSPFLLNVYKYQSTNERNLAGVIGFWAQDNEMIVSQMQSCKNAKFPEGTCLGVASLHIAETAARLMGFEKINAYTARTHPIFQEHPDNWNKLEKDFVCAWDNSARFLGFTPTEGRHGYYFKDLGNNQ